MKISRTRESKLNNTSINTRLYPFPKSEHVEFFFRGKLHASDFAVCASYFEEQLLMRTVHVFQNFYENCKGIRRIPQLGSYFGTNLQSNV